MTASWAGLDALLSRGGSSQAVGLDDKQTWLALAGRREAWRRHLSPLGPGKRLGLFTEDGFEFLAILLGAWSAGLTVVLPGDSTATTTTTLAGICDALAGDLLGALAVPETAGAAQAQAPRSLPALPVVVFTSGSTGAPAAIEKPRRCLDVELETLERTFGHACQGAAVLSTVSHQHYYGLLFKALWPLCAGRASLARQLRLPEELAQACGRAGRAVLVSSPALLKRLAASSEAVEALTPARGVLTAVFSSGGPLPWDAVWRSREALGHAPIEVFGSSETGGVAWRQRQKEDEPWRNLPGVETRLGEAGMLGIRSQHGPDSDWMATSDRAEAVEGGFRLLGRGDRVAKVEEKRLSLDAIESVLGSHAAVVQARVLVLSGAREELGAVLKLLRPVGDDEGRRALIAELRELLSRSFEPVAQPRRWRLVDEWPVNSMGKTTLASLEALFARPQAPRLPQLLFEHRGIDGQAELELLLSPDLLYFQGHFPDVAILPGVVQVHWAAHYASEKLGLAGPFGPLQALKFQRPLRPGMRVTLALKARPDGRGFEFSYHTEAGRHASGRVLPA